MANPIWQPKAPFQSVVFDCDGTLSAIEGIDELARMNGVGDAVEQLTADAMGHTGMNIQLYHRRLDIVKPSQDQMHELANRYYLERSPDIDVVIPLLKKRGKQLIIISAGLYPAVTEFANRLGVVDENVHAVEIDFDPAGNYTDFDQTSPLVTSNGKQSIVLDIQRTTPNIAFIGDGLNDIAVCNLVTRFIGYGGQFYRKNIQDQCEFYLTKPSMLACLPLLLTQTEVMQLDPSEANAYQTGLELLADTLTRSSNTKQSP